MWRACCYLPFYYRLLSPARCRGSAPVSLVGVTWLLVALGVHSFPLTLTPTCGGRPALDCGFQTVTQPGKRLPRVNKERRHALLPPCCDLSDPLSLFPTWHHAGESSDACSHGQPLAVGAPTTTHLIHLRTTLPNKDVLHYRAVVHSDRATFVPDAHFLHCHCRCLRVAGKN